MTKTYIDDSAALVDRLNKANKSGTLPVFLGNVLHAVNKAETDLRKIGIDQDDWKRVVLIVNLECNRQLDPHIIDHSCVATDVRLGYDKRGWFVFKAKSITALPMTAANDRNYFLSIPASVLDIPAVLSGLGISIA